MSKITVTAKITAGYHQGLNANIVKGEEHTIEESQFADQLFERPSPEWLAPWERVQTEQQQPADTPADDIKSGGKKQ